MPEGIQREYEIPYGESEKVDEHPRNVDNLPRGDEDEDTGQTKHRYQ